MEAASDESTRATYHARAAFLEPSVLGDLSLDRFDQAARAISDTRSQVVALKLGLASIRASHATRFLCGALSTSHSGVWATKASCGATSRSASDIASPSQKDCPPRRRPPSTN